MIAIVIVMEDGDTDSDGHKTLRWWGEVNCCFDAAYFCVGDSFDGSFHRRRRSVIITILEHHYYGNDILRDGCCRRC